MTFTDDDREIARLLGRVRETTGMCGDFSIDELRTAGMLAPADYAPDSAIRAIERAESTIASGLSQLRIDLNSGRLYEAGYEERERERLTDAYGSQVQAWSNNLDDHVQLVTAAIKTVTNQLENPRTTWSAAKKSEAESDMVAARRALLAYPNLADLEGQLTAALNSGRDTLLDGWREALLERAAQGKHDALGELWLGKLTKALATDAQLVRLRGALAKRLEKYQEAQQKIRTLTHPRRVEAERQRLAQRYGVGA